MNMEPTEVFPPSSLMPYVFATLGLSRSQQTMALHSAVMDGRGTDLFLSFSGPASSIPGAVRVATAYCTISPVCRPPF